MSDQPDVSQLGQQTALPASPEEAVLERVPNPHPDTAYVARFTAPEFTSLCPVTGQPDFAHLVIDYVPGAWLVESKSLIALHLRQLLAFLFSPSFSSSFSSSRSIHRSLLDFSPQTQQ